MKAAEPATIAAHIRARIAKSGLDSPSVNVTREGWALILDLLDAHALGEAITADMAARANWWREETRRGVYANLPDEIGPIAPEQVLTNADPWAGMSPAEIEAAKART